MQLAEFKELLGKRSHWCGVSTSELLTSVDRLDATSSSLVLTLSGNNLTSTNRLKIEQQLPAQLAEFLDTPLEILTKSGSIGKRPKSAGKPSASKAFGVKMQTMAIPGVKNIICVASGKGGVGKSTISVNLALSLRNLGYEVGIIDADLYGPSIPKMLGCEGILPEVKEGEIWPVEAYGLKAISFASLSPGDAPLIWRGPMVGKALLQFFYQVAWGELDYLILDLPPGTGDVQLTMIERLPVAGAVIVSSPQDLALIDAAKAVQMFRKLKIPVIGLLENMSTFICDNCGKEHHILGHNGAKNYAEQNEIPFLGEVPLHMGYRTAGDSGEPTAAHRDHPLAAVFGEAARKLVNHELLQAH